MCSLLLGEHKSRKLAKLWSITLWGPSVVFIDHLNRFMAQFQVQTPALNGEVRVGV
jgi:hypothetical protein